MFGFGKKKGLASAEKNLQADFCLTLNKIPQKAPVIELFESMSKQGNLCPNAQTALLYRLVVMNFLASAKLMRDGGQDTPPEKLAWLTELLNRSIDWSEKSADYVAFEKLTSQLNMNIESFLKSFAVSRG